MANVKLKTNLVVEGAFLKSGTMIDENKVPTRFRKKKYIVRDGEIDYDAINLRDQMAVAEREIAELDNDDIIVAEGEEKPVVRVANRRLGRR